MTRKIYVVIGETGDYSNYRQWLVCAYMSEDAAKARVLELQELMQTLGVGVIGVVGWEERKRRNDEMRKHDAFFEIDYTDTSYSYKAVELKDA